MKKILSILAAFSLLLSLTACGDGKESEPSTPESSLESSLEESSAEESSALESSEESSEESSQIESSDLTEESEESSVSSESSQTNTTSKTESSTTSEVSKPTFKPESKPETSKPQTPETSEESSQQGPPPAINLDESSQTTESVTADSIFDAIDAAFAEAYPDYGCVIPSMPMDMDKQYIADTLGISVDLLKTAKGQQAGMMTNCDMLIVVEAADGQFDAVKEAMDAALQARYDAFSWYGVMGNGERTEAAKVVTKGNYVALIMVGIMTDEEETPDFSDDVKLAEDTFYNAIG